MRNESINQQPHEIEVFDGHCEFYSSADYWDEKVAANYERNKRSFKNSLPKCKNNKPQITKLEF